MGKRKKSSKSFPSYISISFPDFHTALLPLSCPFLFFNSFMSYIGDPIDVSEILGCRGRPEAVDDAGVNMILNEIDDGSFELKTLRQSQVMKKFVNASVEDQIERGVPKEHVKYPSKSTMRNYRTLLTGIWHSRRKARSKDECRRVAQHSIRNLISNVSMSTVLLYFAEDAETRQIRSALIFNIDPTWIRFNEDVSKMEHTTWDPHVCEVGKENPQSSHGSKRKLSKSINLVVPMASDGRVGEPVFYKKIDGSADQAKHIYVRVPELTCTNAPGGAGHLHIFNVRKVKDEKTDKKIPLMSDGDIFKILFDQHFLPFMGGVRTQSKFGKDFATKPAALFLDGAQEQIDYIIAECERLRRMYLAVGKTPASATGSYQAADLAECFKRLKALLADLYEPTEVGKRIETVVKKGLRGSNMPSSYQNAIPKLLARMPSVLAESFCKKYVKGGFKKSGWGTSDRDAMWAAMAKQCTGWAWLDKPERDRIRALIPHFCNLVKEKGYITEEEFDAKEIPKDIDYKAANIPRNERKHCSHRGEILTHEGVRRWRQQYEEKKLAAKAAAEDRGQGTKKKGAREENETRETICQGNLLRTYMYTQTHHTHIHTQERKKFVRAVRKESFCLDDSNDCCAECFVLEEDWNEHLPVDRPMPDAHGWGFQKCELCSKSWCGWCMPQFDFQAHKSACRKRKIARGKREKLALKEQKRNEELKVKSLKQFKSFRKKFLKTKKDPSKLNSR